MSKKTFYISCLLLIIYIILYKTIFISYQETFQYLINPLIWVIGTIIIYLINKKRPSFPFKKSIIYRVSIIALVYIILFYTLGLFFKFAHNPYSTTFSGLIINFFSLLLVIILKEIIRSILVNKAKEYNRWSLFLTFFIFFLSDLDFSFIFNPILSNLLIFIVSDLLVTIITNLFYQYLVLKAGYQASIIYRIILFLPFLIIPIIPDYNWLILAFFNISLPILSYLFIEYFLRQKDRFISIEEKNVMQPKGWVVAFLLVTLAIIFAYGGFGVKPVVILSASMHPTIYEGDLLIIKPCSINKVNVGDIIRFQINEYTIVHRVVRLYKNNNDIKLITKGDNNNNEDQYPVTSKNFLGCLQQKIPYLGYPTYLISQIFNVNTTVTVETGG